ncbi:MAG: glycosyltransferase [Thermodesulfobacteriota bacterium]
MRVAFNTYSAAFDCPGGGEIQLLKTKEALEKRGMEVLLLDPRKPDLNGVRIVHHFSVQGGSMEFCSHVKENLGLPLAVSPILWLGGDKSAYPLDEIGRLLNLCDIILPNSTAELKLLSEFFDIPEGKFHVTRNSVDPEFAGPVEGELFREKFGVKGPFLLNAANIEPRKNQLNLIRAAGAMGMELILLGNVRVGTYFNACKEAGGSGVRYLGYVEHGSELLRSAYNACEAFVLPSLLETPGLAALEAAAAGARVVITGVGPIEEYFADMVTRVDPNDPDDIRRGIETELAARRDNSLSKRIMENFTWDKTALEVQEAYEKVLGGPAAPPGGG